MALVVLLGSILMTGCLGGGDASKHAFTAPPHGGGPRAGDVDGHIAPGCDTTTADCAGYRGSVRLCPTAGSFGPKCRLIRVDANGDFHARLDSMMWKLTPKPTKGSQVTIPTETFGLGGGEVLKLRFDPADPGGWVLTHTSGDE
jgi:hypothetical protein